MRTKAFFEKFKGHPLFAIWEVDANDNKVGQYPLFSMGGKKAHALAAHLEDFKQFVASVPAPVVKKEEDVEL